MSTKAQKTRELKSLRKIMDHVANLEFVTGELSGTLKLLKPIKIGKSLYNRIKAHISEVREMIWVVNDEILERIEELEIERGR